MDVARIEGLSEEISIGKSEGIRLGKKEAVEKIARKLLKIGLPIEQIIETTGLTKVEIEELNLTEKEQKY